MSNLENLFYLGIYNFQISHIMKYNVHSVHIKRNKFLNIQFTVSGFFLNKFLLHDLIFRTILKRHYIQKTIILPFLPVLNG